MSLLSQVIKKFLELQLIILKNIIEAVATYIGIAFLGSIVYVMIAFISLETDVAKWSPFGRFILAIITFFLFIFAHKEVKAKLSKDSQKNDIPK